MSAAEDLIWRTLVGARISLKNCSGVINDSAFVYRWRDHQRMRVAVFLDILGRDDDDVNGVLDAMHVQIDFFGQVSSMDIARFDDSRSRSLFGPISPRAPDLKRMMRSGAATSTMRRMISSREAWLMRCLVFIETIITRAVTLGDRPGVSV
jgi:hypothetical protein